MGGRAEDGAGAGLPRGGCRRPEDDGTDGARDGVPRRNDRQQGPPSGAAVVESLILAQDQRWRRA